MLVAPSSRRSWYYLECKQGSVILTWPHPDFNGAALQPVPRYMGVQRTQGTPGSCLSRVVPCKIIIVECSAAWSHCDLVVGPGHMFRPSSQASTFALLASCASQKHTRTETIDQMPLNTKLVIWVRTLPGFMLSPMISGREVLC